MMSALTQTLGHDDVTPMIADSISDQVRYFKRYRMELDLVPALPSVPSLPTELHWRSWDERLLEMHAEVKCRCFENELDSVVFPNLSNRLGCLRLMRDIANRPGFCVKATWLLCDGDVGVGTVQGIGDRIGAGNIQNLGIVPAYRGRGLGAALLLQALHGFRQSGLAKATLEVTAQNEIAIQMYRRFGFRFRKTLYRCVDTPTYRLEPAEQPAWVL